MKKGAKGRNGATTTAKPSDARDVPLLGETRRMQLLSGDRLQSDEMHCPTGVVENDELHTKMS
jgi:hypothetical protein